MKGHLMLAGAVLTVAAVTGCSASGESASEADTPAAVGESFKACQVTDSGGVDDKSFNQTAYAGLQRAAEEFGLEAIVLESDGEADYAPNIETLVAQDCRIIVTVGYLLSDATKQAANASPDLAFSIVDFAYEPGQISNNNVLGQVFDANEAAFLAGYLAAGMTTSGTVGTFGGLNIPTVTTFMDGFFYGVAKYNADNGTDVRVLGWDPTTASGLFTDNFDSAEDGRRLTQDLVDRGADIVMPVAGPVGLGAAGLASELGTDALAIIGVDADQYALDTANRDVYLTSVLKNIDVTTFDAVAAVVEGTFTGGVIRGTLANGGVGLAPFHEFESAVPPELAAELEEIKAGIIDGSVSVTGS